MEHTCPELERANTGFVLGRDREPWKATIVAWEETPGVCVGTWGILMRKEGSNQMNYPLIPNRFSFCPFCGQNLVAILQEPATATKES